MAKEKQAAGSNPAYAEMSRRMGFEYNGMVLHEYYFNNLNAGRLRRWPQRQAEGGPRGELHQLRHLARGL